MDDTAKPDTYILATGESAAWRLRLLQSIYGASTRALLLRAGLWEGQRAADLGCGIGSVSQVMAQIVGPTGSVVGVDGSAAQLEVARADAERAGLTSVEFRQGDASATGLERGSFDLVYCRFLLIHVQRPFEVLQEMRALLKPNGVLVCEEIECSTLATVPPTPVYTRAAADTVAGGRKRGVDNDIGCRLPAYFQSLGLQAVQVDVWQPAFLRGEEKRFWEHSVAEAAPRLAEVGVRSAEELRDMVEGMRQVNADESVLLLLPRHWQVWGRKGA